MKLLAEKAGSVLRGSNSPYSIYTGATYENSWNYIDLDLTNLVSANQGFREFMASKGHGYAVFLTRRNSITECNVRYRAKDLVIYVNQENKVVGFVDYPLTREFMNLFRSS